MRPPPHWHPLGPPVRRLCPHLRRQVTEQARWRGSAGPRPSPAGNATPLHAPEEIWDMVRKRGKVSVYYECSVAWCARQCMLSMLAAAWAATAPLHCIQLAHLLFLPDSSSCVLFGAVNRLLELGEKAQRLQGVKHCRGL